MIFKSEAPWTSNARTANHVIGSSSGPTSLVCFNTKPPCCFFQKRRETMLIQPEKYLANDTFALSG